MRFKSIIWDFDGTLFDTYPPMVAAFKKALADYDVEAEDERILEHMRISHGKAIDYYRGKYGLSEEFNKAFLYHQEFIRAEDVKPFPYAKEVCTSIIEAGGTNYIVTHRDPKSLLEYLSYHDMLKLFKENVTSESGFKRKPDPEAYEYLLNKYCISPEDALIVGDREFELAAAQNAGVKSCLYDTNNIEIVTKPNFRVESLRELEKIIF